MTPPWADRCCPAERVTAAETDTQILDRLAVGALVRNPHRPVGDRDDPAPKCSAVTDLPSGVAPRCSTTTAVASVPIEESDWRR